MLTNEIRRCLCGLTLRRGEGKEEDGRSPADWRTGGQCSLARVLFSLPAWVGLAGSLGRGKQVPVNPSKPTGRNRHWYGGPTHTRRAAGPTLSSSGMVGCPAETSESTAPDFRRSGVRSGVLPINRGCTVHCPAGGRGESHGQVGRRRGQGDKRAGGGEEARSACPSSGPACLSYGCLARMETGRS